MAVDGACRERVLVGVVGLMVEGEGEVESSSLSAESGTQRQKQARPRGPLPSHH